MKIENPSKLIDSNLSSESISFSLNHNQKMFSVLSDNLYLDKIGSIVRELASNAIDSHKEANNLNPFDIFLPNELDSNFTISDYGMGLSKEDLTTLYTQYGESTKTDTNELIGGFGLGSKSPFAYTKSFQIISYHNNMRYVGLAFLNEEGIPHFNILSEEKSNRINGVSISFHVKKENFEDFKVAVDEQLNFVKFPFNIDGEIVDNRTKYDDNGHLKQFNFLLNYDKPHSIISNILSVESQNEIGCSIFALGTKSPTFLSKCSDIAVYVMIGGIRYTLNFSELCEIVKDKKVLIFLQSFLQGSFMTRNLVIGLYCNIGDIDLLASREKLSLSQKTVSKLQELLQKIYEEVMRELEELYLKDKYLYKLYILNKLYCYYTTPTINNNLIYLLDNFVSSLDDDKKYLFDYKKSMLAYTKTLNIVLTTSYNKKKHTRSNVQHQTPHTITKQLDLVEFLPYVGYSISDVSRPYIGNIKCEEYIPKIYLNDTDVKFNKANLMTHFKYGDIIIKPKSGVSLNQIENDIKSLLYDLGNPVLHKVSEAFPDIVVDKTPRIDIKYSTYIYTKDYNYWKEYYDDEKIKNKKVVYIITNQNSEVDVNNKIYNKIFAITPDKNVYNYNSIIGHNCVLIRIYKSNLKRLLKICKDAISFDEYIECHHKDIITDTVNIDKVNTFLNYSYRLKKLEKYDIGILNLIYNIRMGLENKEYNILPFLHAIKPDEIRNTCIMIKEALQKEIKENILEDGYLLNIFELYDDDIKNKRELIDNSIKKFFETYTYISYIIFPSINRYTTHKEEIDKKKEAFKRSIEIINKLYQEI